jgi:hypothetical protein
MVIDKLIDITAESRLLVDINDILDEISMVQSLIDHQERALKSFGRQLGRHMESYWEPDPSPPRLAKTHPVGILKAAKDPSLAVYSQEDAVPDPLSAGLLRPQATSRPLSKVRFLPTSRPRKYTLEETEYAVSLLPIAAWTIDH